MQSLIDGMRQIIGEPSFLLTSGDVDYGAVIEYVFAGIIACICVASVFKFIMKLVD